MNTPINMFLNLSKPFDSFDHQIPFKKLKYYGLNV